MFRAGQVQSKINKETGKLFLYIAHSSLTYRTVLSARAALGINQQQAQGRHHTLVFDTLTSTVLSLDDTRYILHKGVSMWVQ